MAKTRTLDRDRLVAGAVAVAIHLLLACGVARLLQVTIPRHASPQVTQLFWVPVPPDPAAMAVEEPRRSKPADVGSPATRPPVEPTSLVVASDPTRVAIAPPRPATAYVDQARRWAERQAPIGFKPPDPLARPSTDLPGRAGRLHVRERLGAADVVARIATVLGGPGYNPDPCPELRKDVNDLALAGDSQALQDALYYEKRGCR